MPAPVRTRDTNDIMKRRRPPLYSVLALWLSCTLSATAQEFYIELRGPDTPAVRSPASSTPEAPPAPAQASRYGPITPTDTLWSIAARHTRAPVTVQQTMVALYYLNPNAFVRGNINYLQRGAMLRLPTVSQAQQRSPREAETEFRRLSRQGNRSVTRAPATPAPSRAAPVASSRPADTAAPAVATPPVAEIPPRPAPAAPVQASAQAEPASAPAPSRATGLSEPRVAQPATATPQPSATEAAPEPAGASGPERAEQAALERLQARLLDELREQVAMSNEQLAQLADNNQALRHRLGQLTAEVNELKMVRAQQAMPEAKAAVKQGGWFSELLKQPLNLALLLTLPALLLLALFTLWWRKRIRDDLAEQEAEASPLMMEDEPNDFDDLFATELSTVDEEPPSRTAGADEEVEIDEDAFARFLEEQERQEREEAGTAADIPQTDVDEVLFDDEPPRGQAASTQAENPDDLLFDDAVGNATADPDENFADTLFDDQAAREQGEPAFDDTPDDTLFDDAAMQPEADLAFDDSLDERLFEERPADAEQDLDDSLFDLDEPDEGPAPEPPTQTEPVSLADQGAFDDDAVSRFDDVLADSLAEQQGAGEQTAKPEDAASLSGDREGARRELDDYASLLGNGQDVDIDLDEGGMGAKLDLARAYIEIDDLDSARELLNEALEQGNEQQQNDARKLLQRLGRR